MALVVYGIDPLLRDGYHVQRILLPELMGVPAPYVMGALVLGSAVWLRTIRRPGKR